ncbi:MAG: hypothetical protein KDJ75_07655 [Alphaproteobacteria bacterium]|nr:hypothetical protein [Alphaproteobacteria bacterium]
MSSKAEIEQSVTALFNEKRNLIIVSDVSETLLLPEGQVNTDLYAFLIKAAMDEHKVFIASQGPLQILLDIHRQLLSKQLKDTFSQEAINGFFQGRSIYHKDSVRLAMRGDDQEIPVVDLVIDDEEPDYVEFRERLNPKDQGVQAFFADFTQG